MPTAVTAPPPLTVATLRSLERKVSPWGGAGRGDAAGDLGRLAGLEDQVVGVQVDAVGGDIDADVDGADDVPAGDGDGGGAFAHRSDPAEIVDGGHGLIRGGQS